MRNLVLCLVLLGVMSCEAPQPGPKKMRIAKSVGETKDFESFEPIAPSSEDKLVLPAGFAHQVLVSYDDVINSQGDRFGFNNDHVEFFPVDGLKGGGNSRDGLLVVNHEYYGRYGSRGKTPEEIKKEKYAVGMSVFRVKKKGKRWEIDLKDNRNRRYTALSRMRVSGAAQNVLGKEIIGTMDNCSGGQTPWGTMLSGEESLTYGKDRGWPGFKPETIGWMVEVDPYDPSHIPVKHSALGRFKHENAAVRIAKSGEVVVYMGDDTMFGGLYKFVSRGKYLAGNRKANLALLSEGTLYGARMSSETEPSGSGTWVAIDLNDPVSGKILRSAGYKSQGEVLVDTVRAGRLLRVSRLDRPEDCEVHPQDGSVYVALTNNMKRIPPNPHGSVIRLVEKGSDPLAKSFSFETFVKGGVDGGFSSPDNLVFDSKGNLWMCSDVSSKVLGRALWSSFKNNGLYMLKTTGPDKGLARQFASGPSGSELSGPWFTPDGKSLFLSVMHPGEGGDSSSWPGKGEAKPSVVVIWRE